MKEYKIGRYYIENIDQFKENTGNNTLKRSICLVLDKASRPGDWKISEVNIFDTDTFGRYCTFGRNTILSLNELSITIKRSARVNEIFEFWIGLKNFKDDE